VFCVLSTAAAAEAAQTPFQKIQAYFIPVVSVIGGFVTYLAVGDRLLASCAPSCHARWWRGVAFFIGHTLGPLCALLCCCCCRARAVDTFHGIAAGVLKRLADLEEHRVKSEAAKSKLKLTSVPAAAAAGEAPLPAVVNPLLYNVKATEWVQRGPDAEGDVWFQRLGGEETCWELPINGVLVAVGGGDAASGGVVNGGGMV
jgi:hypothetical protein